VDGSAWATMLPGAEQNSVPDVGVRLVEVVGFEVAGTFISPVSSVGPLARPGRAEVRQSQCCQYTWIQCTPGVQVYR